jgi:hypothetical protein
MNINLKIESKKLFNPFKMALSQNKTKPLNFVKSYYNTFMMVQGSEYKQPKKQELFVIHTNYGGLFEATLNGKEISEVTLKEIIGAKPDDRRRIEFLVFNFKKRNKNYNVEIWERDVS